VADDNDDEKRKRKQSTVADNAATSSFFIGVMGTIANCLRTRGECIPNVQKLQRSARARTCCSILIGRSTLPTAENKPRQCITVCQSKQASVKAASDCVDNTRYPHQDLQSPSFASPNKPGRQCVTRRLPMQTGFCQGCFPICGTIQDTHTGIYIPVFFSNPNKQASVKAASDCVDYTRCSHSDWHKSAKKIGDIVN